MVSEFLSSHDGTQIPESVEFKEKQVNSWTSAFVDAAQKKADKEGGTHAPRRGLLTFALLAWRTAFSCAYYEVELATTCPQGIGKVHVFFPRIPDAKAATLLVPA